MLQAFPEYKFSSQECRIQRNVINDVLCRNIRASDITDTMKHARFIICPNEQFEQFLCVSAKICFIIYLYYNSSSQVRSQKLFELFVRPFSPLLVLGNIAQMAIIAKNNKLSELPEEGIPTTVSPISYLYSNRR